MENTDQPPLILDRQYRQVAVDQQARRQLLIRPGVDPHRFTVHQSCDAGQRVSNQQSLERDAPLQTPIRVDHIDVAKQLGIVPGIVDQLLGLAHGILFAHGQVFMTHVGPDRLGRPVEQGVVHGLSLGRKTRQQHGAILTAELAQDSHHLATGNGFLQDTDDAAMHALQQATRTLCRERSDKFSPLRHRQGIKDAVELFRTEGQQLIGTLNRIQIVFQPTLQAGEIEQLMTVENGVCFLHHK